MKNDKLNVGDYVFHGTYYIYKIVLVDPESMYVHVHLVATWNDFTQQFVETIVYNMVQKFNAAELWPLKTLSFVSHFTITGILATFKWMEQNMKLPYDEGTAIDDIYSSVRNVWTLYNNFK